MLKQGVIFDKPSAERIAKVVRYVDPLPRATGRDYRQHRREFVPVQNYRPITIFNHSVYTIPIGGFVRLSYYVPTVEGWVVDWPECKGWDNMAVSATTIPPGEMGTAHASGIMRVRVGSLYWCDRIWEVGHPPDYMVDGERYDSFIAHGVVSQTGVAFCVEPWELGPLLAVGKDPERPYIYCRLVGRRI